MAADSNLYARCRKCDHRWLVVKTPMQLSKAAELMKRAACPACGDTKPFAATSVDSQDDDNATGENQDGQAAGSAKTGTRMRSGCGK